MNSRETIINGLEIILHGCDDIQCKDCEFHIKTPATPARCGLDEEQIEEAALELLKEQIPDSSKYQYKYDHTDCIWYHDSRSKCPVTCSQYRDGWNDAMKYIFKDGKGYSPYKRR